MQDDRIIEVVVKYQMCRLQFRDFLTFPLLHSTFRAGVGTGSVGHCRTDRNCRSATCTCLNRTWPGSFPSCSGGSARSGAFVRRYWLGLEVLDPVHRMVLGSMRNMEMGRYGCRHCVQRHCVQAVTCPGSRRAGGRLSAQATRTHGGVSGCSGAHGNLAGPLQRSRAGKQSCSALYRTGSA